MTACHAANAREGIDFLPLTVDYREYTYASGRIPGGFFKREGKPAEKEVLTSRMIDRPTRPLFPEGWRFETQIIALVLSADQANDTDVLAITGASVALALSDMPFEKTIAAVRMGLVDGQYVVNPTFKQRKESKLDLIVVGSMDGLVMVEAGAKEVSEEQVVTALDTAHAAIKQIVAVIDDLAKECGKKKMAVEVKALSAGIEADVEAKLHYKPLQAAMRIREKLENYSTVDQVKKDLVASYPDTEAERKADAKVVFSALKEKVLREEVLTNGVRLWTVGRKFDEIRNDLDRDRRPAARLTARPCSRAAKSTRGARHLHARHRRRCPEDRELRGGNVEELHAPLWSRSPRQASTARSYPAPTSR